MIALDTTFLVDHLDGVDAAAEYLATHGDRPLVTPSLSLYEAYRGVVRGDGLDGVMTVADTGVGGAAPAR